MASNEPSDELAQHNYGRLELQARLPRSQAADLSARLRNVHLGGGPLRMSIRPSLSRSVVREARLVDARRRRDTTPGLPHPKAQFDEEGRFSLTPLELGKKIASGVHGLHVVDAGCGVGGNCIAFALAGANVTAIERDPTRIKLAQHNAKLFGCASQIRFVHADATRWLSENSGDVLFLDPPWGTDWNKPGVGVDSFPLVQWLMQETPRFSEVRLKLPPSFDDRTLPTASWEAFFGTATGDRQRIKFVVAKLDQSSFKQ